MAVAVHRDRDWRGAQAVVRDVDAVAAGDPISAVRGGLGDDDVVAGGAVDDVVAEAADEPVRGGAADNPVVAAATGDVLDVGAHEVAFAGLAVVAEPVEVHGHGDRAVAVHDPVDPRAAPQVVGTINGAVREQDVVPGAAVDDVVAVAARQGVAAEPAGDHVRVGVAGDAVAPAAAVDVLEVAPKVVELVDRTVVGRVVEVDRDRHVPQRVVREVDAAAADHGVGAVAGRLGHVHVSAGAQVDRVVAGAGKHAVVAACGHQVVRCG